MPSRIEIIEADITTLEIQAIVNAANSSMKAGGGVDAAIHQKAGPKLQEECLHLAPCPVGEVRITRGYDLPADFIIHTVGPKWAGGEEDEDNLLALCYTNVLELAANFDIKNIAFPAISTGSYGFPKQRAALIAMKQIISYLESDKDMERIVLCCFNTGMALTYEAAFDKLDIKKFEEN